MQLYVMLTPEDWKRANKLPVRFAHVAYGINKEGVLVRCVLPGTLYGGIMVIGDCCPSRFPSPQNLVQSVLRECSTRQYEGVLADFERQPTPDRFAFLETLGQALIKTGRKLFVPQRYAVSSSAVLVCTALSGGTMDGMLRDVTAYYGTMRVALDFQKLMMDFTVPCPSGNGKVLNEEDFFNLKKRCCTSSFFSTELCARYFLYRENGRAHFVLYDDADTLHRKQQMAQNFQIPYGFYLYPEISKICGKIF